VAEKIDKARQLLEMAMKNGAESADVLLSDSVSIGTSIRLGQLEEMERAESGGIGLRVFIGQQQGVASGSDLRSDSLSQIAERAVAIARQAPEDSYAGLPEKAAVAVDWPMLDLVDAQEPPVDWLLERCRELEETALAVEGITNSEGGNAGYSRGALSLLTSDGFEGSYARTSFSESVCVLAGEGTGMERDYAYHTTRHRNSLKPCSEIGREAAERTLKRLHPRKVKTCKVPVIFDPRVARSLLGNFAGAINGAAVARGTSFLKDKMGQAVFSPHITVTDDPHLARGLGSRPFDGEGCASAPLTLVEDGVLQHWLLDSRSARQLGLKTNGRAARGLSSGTSPATTNLTLQPGEISTESMIGEIESGFYVNDCFGMGINLVTGDYSQGASGFWIEKGKLAYPVSEVTIASTLQEMFAELEVANDITADYATNAPTLRIAQMTVAGN